MAKDKKEATMRKKIIILILMALYIFLLGGCAQKEQTTILTIKDATFQFINGNLNIKELNLIDKDGKEITFLDNANEWFENGTVDNYIIPEGTSLTLSGDNKGNLVVKLVDEAKLLFNFNVGGTIYPIGIGVGSQFEVKKTESGKYDLLPEETAKLSPPPVLEEE